MRHYKVRVTLNLHDGVLSREFVIDEATFEKLSRQPGQDEWLLLPQQGGGACILSTKRIAMMEMWQTYPDRDEDR